MDLPPRPGRVASVRTLLLYLTIVVVFAAVTVAIEIALGGTPRGASTPGAWKSVEDAVWHVATAFLLVLPVRSRRLSILFPAAALGLDADHLFGAFLPSVTGRTAHSLFLLLTVAFVLARVEGSAAGLFGAAAVAQHLAVDGGPLPLLGPLSTSEWSLSVPIAAGVLLAVTGALVLAARGPGGLREPRRLVWIVGVWAVAVAALVIVPPFTDFLTS